MPPSDVLVVLIVRQAALRSSLVARLSVAGAELITASRLDDPSLESGIRRPAVLVLDEEGVSDRPPRALQALLDDARWRRVVLLCEDPATRSPMQESSRLMWMERTSAPSALAGLVPQWRLDTSA